MKDWVKRMKAIGYTPWSCMRYEKDIFTDRNGIIHQFVIRGCQWGWRHIKPQQTESKIRNKR